MSNFAETTLNAGSGGPLLALDTFTNAGTGHTDLMPYSAIAFGTLGGGSYQAVDGSHGLPVNVVAGTVILGAGSAVIGSLANHQSTNVDQIGGSALALGQAAMAASLPVVIANNQTAVPISAASLPLPTGAAADGTDITGSVMPSGGAGIRGWLSAIYTWLKTQLVFGQGTMAASLPVTIASNQSAVPVSGTFWQATQPVSIAGTVTVSGSGTFTVAGTVTANQGTPNTAANSWPVEVTDGTNVLGTSSHPMRIDPTGTTTQPVSIAGNQAVNVAQVAGTATSVNEGSSDAGTTRVCLGTDDNILTYSIWSAATDNANNVKSSAGHLFKITVTNSGSGAVFLKIYNKATAPAPASDTPVQRYIVPGNTAGAGLTVDFFKGRNFSSGIGYVLSGAAGDTDTTAIAANQCAINIDYR